MLAAGDYGGALKLACELKDEDILRKTVEATLADDVEPGQSSSKLNYHDAVLVCSMTAEISLSGSLELSCWCAQRLLLKFLLRCC
mmetsp:Transcript_35798/g.143070  ORF Transcript_35798/g.143070 Transcript_35798/m.143070 type:complete len:85 (-) Transcript_35798:776-1030(-)